MMPAQETCWEVYFAGRVQGVGFRFTTRSIAAGFAVTGFVENLSDGRVHVVVEGEAAELERFIAAIERDLAVHIRSQQIDRRAATGQYLGFEIR